MHGKGALLGDHCISVMLPQTITYVAMDLLIKWTNFGKNVLKLLLKCVILVFIQPQLGARSEVCREDESRRVGKV